MHTLILKFDMIYAQVMDGQSKQLILCIIIIINIAGCMIVVVKDAGSDRKSKFKVYSEICRHFVPVFHHFFMEKFPSPPQWFERRLAYTRSVAASSIGQYNWGSLSLSMCVWLFLQWAMFLVWAIVTYRIS